MYNKNEHIITRELTTDKYLEIICRFYQFYQGTCQTNIADLIKSELETQICSKNNDEHDNNNSYPVDGITDEGSVRVKRMSL